MCSGRPIDPATALSAGAWSKIWRTVPPGRGSIATPRYLKKPRKSGAFRCLRLPTGRPISPWGSSFG